MSTENVASQYSNKAAMCQVSFICSN